MPPSSDNPDVAHQPAVAFFLIMVTVAALAMTLINLRNARSWLLRVIGRRVSGVVANIEIVTSPTGEVLRRPTVAFTTEEGRQMVGAPVVYRESVVLAKGSPVIVRYARRNPSRMVVRGYDLRVREPVYAVLGVVIALCVATAYFKI
jgi:hypothetical protein